MGRAKDRMIQEKEQGWYFTDGERYVCADCVTDEALKEVVEGHLESNACSYCGRREDESIAAPLDDILEVMAEGLAVEWGDAVEELPYESAEGGYQGTTYDTWEFFADVVGFPTEDDALQQDIAHAFRDRVWCQRNYFSVNAQEVLIFGWEEFCDVVKHQTRYFFFEPEDVPEGDDIFFSHRESLSPAEVLRKIESLTNELGLVRRLPQGKLFARARTNGTGSPHLTAIALGPPPADKALVSNRMSPAGIPMFYGAEDVETAIAETTEGPANVSVGLFETLKELNVLDLTNLPDPPSVYIAEASELRFGINFLRRFAADLKKPIERDGREHIEYVPTQVVTEYLRHIFRDQDGNSLDGVLYPSTKRDGGINCVLFCENQNCCDVVPSDEFNARGMMLRLREVLQEDR